MDEQTQKVLGGINLFPKEHVWIPTEVRKDSWDNKRLQMGYVHRPITKEDKLRRTLIIELLKADTLAEAKVKIHTELAKLGWPCNE